MEMASLSRRNYSTSRRPESFRGILADGGNRRKDFICTEGGALFPELTAWTRGGLVNGKEGILIFILRS
jgi:hypothetical protein